jgi:hypothetical protein
MTTKAQTDKFIQKQMQNCLDSLGINLMVQWFPDETKSVHGEIKGNMIFLYNREETQAWQTFGHELCEYKLQSVTRLYRLLVNTLIETIEKSIYTEKEQFIDFLPKMIETIRECQKNECKEE